MATARRNNEDAPLNECEQERLANIARNKEKLASLNLLPCEKCDMIKLRKEQRFCKKFVTSV